MTLWTPPRTWVTGETVTAANMNTHVRDNLKNLDERTLFVRKTTTESVVSSAALQDDDQLLLSAAASSTYVVDVLIRYDAATAGDIRVLLVGPTGAVFTGWGSGLHATAAATNDDRLASLLTGDASEVFGGLGVGVFTAIHIHGNLLTDTTAGTFKLQWAQGTSSASATRVIIGSHLSLRKVV